MNLEYELNLKILKVLSDLNRFEIIKILFFKEKCVCEILKNFNIL